ncbi:MAG: transporter substrate-binding domain-containing protein [Planctomycetes bacterium]|nr:transporter substrate-binding domain-containing protein [Planctomycetota bacterium]
MHIRLQYTVLLVLLLLSAPAWSADLADVRRQGVLRHLGIPYAHFVIDGEAGMDVELMRAFAKDIGVRYEYVRSDWPRLFGELLGTTVKPKGDDVERLGPTEVRGDVIANGLTVLPWRQKIVAFSAPTFPNQVWLVARADSALSPIVPSQDIQADIAAVKGLIAGRSLLGKSGTCLDPALYDLARLTQKILLFQGSLNDLAPALIQGEAELTLLDVPDALVALQKWPGKLKILGPVSERQDMGVAFAQDAPELHARFNEFLARSRADGSFATLVRKHYPFVHSYYPDFLGTK